MTPEELRAALELRDLTDPEAGEHAMQHVVSAIEYALARAWGIPVRRDPGPRIVTVADNYDRLRYSAEAVTRDRRYSRYLDGGRMLRSHTTARIPALLDANALPDVLFSVPGVCYRRDVIDRQHVGEPLHCGPGVRGFAECSSDRALGVDASARRRGRCGLGRRSSGEADQPRWTTSGWLSNRPPYGRLMVRR